MLFGQMERGGEELGGGAAPVFGVDYPATTVCGCFAEDVLPIPWTIF